MPIEYAVAFLTFIALVTANIPWIVDELFIFIKLEQGKNFWLRLGEWLVFYLLVGGIAILLELNQNGVVHSQGWEFYVTTLCLYMVFALPGFIYRYEFRRYLTRA